MSRARIPELQLRLGRKREMPRQKTVPTVTAWEEIDR